MAQPFHPDKVDPAVIDLISSDEDENDDGTFRDVVVLKDGNVSSCGRSHWNSGDERDSGSRGSNPIASSSRRRRRTSTDENIVPHSCATKKSNLSSSLAWNDGDKITTRRKLQTGIVLEEDTDRRVEHRAPAAFANGKDNSNGSPGGGRRPFGNVAFGGKCGSKLAADAASSSSNSSLNTTTRTESANDTTTAQGYVQRQLQRQRSSLPPILYHDTEFEPIPSSINGLNAKSVPKCQCSPSLPTVLSYSTRDGPNLGRPYHRCRNKKCKYFKWAYVAELMRWYRFGAHNNHVLVKEDGFAAKDLVQGKVGDCWFLSALAVIAERPDLILRLFSGMMENRSGGGGALPTMNECGIVEVKLFLDGYWTPVLIDNFLPCMIDDKGGEKELELALRQSLIESGHGTDVDFPNPPRKSASGSSKFDPYALSDKNRQVLRETNEFIEQDRYKNDPSLNRETSSPKNYSVEELNRPVTSDLAYSRAKQSQLWVPLLEKAYAKAHGSYQSISGGQIAEAFLDLTGAPTLVYNFDSRDFHGREFWYKLMSYRKRGLPMGCCTSGGGKGGSGLGEVGLVSMHAYSILDVREVRNVGVEFFRERLLTETLGNISGFTEFDGTVRLLRIRNPHGKGEWKGEFSDKSAAWERLLMHREEEGEIGSSPPSHYARFTCSSPPLQRTMTNDGTFWIDYDNFLMGFSNVDVVLAFPGNHGRSFGSNFPMKKSNHRCSRAFEVSLIDPQPGLPARDTVELFIMGIQKTRRGASHGRTDRKKSYKVCDLGMIVGKRAAAPSEEMDTTQGCNDLSDDEDGFDTVEGQMFGFRRDGHYRLILNRTKNRSFVVMPISFGHPAATDADRSFVLRFVSDAPLLIKELPYVPRMDLVMKKFCVEASCCVDNYFGEAGSKGLDGQERQGKRQVLLEDLHGIEQFGEPTHRVFFIDCLGDEGGTAFVYLWVNDKSIEKRRAIPSKETDCDISFSIEANCRGMLCRTADGLLEHETVSKGQKFQASWRRFTKHFYEERQSRLLMVLVQSGVDTEMGSIKCESLTNCDKESATSSKQGRSLSLTKYFDASPPGSSKSSSPSSASSSPKRLLNDYEKFGIFNATDNKTKDGVHCAFTPASLYGTASFNSGNRQELLDLELEAALALSRGDVELQQALELSRTDAERHGSLDVHLRDKTSCSSMDEQLQKDTERAILDSIQVNGNPSPSWFLGSTEPQGPKTFSQEMEEAIRLSMEDSGVTANTSSSFSVPPNRNDPIAVISLTSDSPDRCDVEQRTRPFAKKRRTDRTVTELIDDEPSRALNRKDAEDRKVRQNIDTSEKRRLAAEAALKRYSPAD